MNEPNRNDSSRSDSAVQALPPTPNPYAKRLSGSQLVDKARRLTARLQANARWMKQFLHGNQ